jgi:hypothetical protein
MIMASESKTTTDHKTIQQWAEARDGKPTSVKGTEKDGEAGLLRIDFPGYSGGDRLEEISWDEFFKKFDEKNLAFLYQEHTSSGEESRFFKLIGRDSAEHKSTSHGKSHTADETHKAAQHTEHKSDDKAHKAEHKTEHKADDKAHKSEHKSDEKAHKAEHKSDDKAEHKSDEKAHKSSTNK